jgi:beta-lactam-binding protein with PASTA domain/tRNA A-37 threonylcarbamoyl transferase component Bud32
MAPPRIADQLGRVLGGRYRLVAALGTGASAHVYVADDVALRRRVAVKVLHPALASDETFLRRFRSEAQAVAALRHPHVMQVFDWGEDGDGPYLVLEYLSGGSLRDLLDRGHRLTPSQALLVALQAAQALDYAHRRGLVHRDIKPANLLFDDEGHVAIADFGLARALAEAAWTEPAGAIVGTARYASPEQARGSRVDGRADVYALALVIVEMVTGQVPFAADTTIATLMARLDRDLAAPDGLEELAFAVEGAGRADPDARIDAAELVRRLEAAATALPPPAALPVVSSAPVVDPVHGVDDLTVLPGPSTARPRLYDVPVTDEPATASRPGRRGRLRRWLWPIAAVVLAAALAAGAVVASGANKPQHEVANLQRLTVADARRAVAPSKFRIDTRPAYDENVPAGRIVSQSPFPGEKAKEGDHVRVLVSKGPKPRVVPDLAGKNADEAKRLVEAEHLVFQQVDGFSDTVPKGVVVEWSPKGSVGRDTPVTVTVSKGPQPKPVPSLAERAADLWRKALEELGFKVRQEDAFSDDVAKGEVVTTRPPPGTEAQPGDEVVLVVSKGPDLVTVPDVSGQSVSDADDQLQRAGLYASGVEGSPVRTVRATRPAAGTQVKRGTGVVLVTGKRD